MIDFSQPSMGWSDLREQSEPWPEKSPDPNVALVCWEKNHMDMVDFETCSVWLGQTTIMIPNTVEVAIQNLIFWDVTYDTQHFDSQNFMQVSQ